MSCEVMDRKLFKVTMLQASNGDFLFVGFVDGVTVPVGISMYILGSDYKIRSGHLSALSVDRL